MVSDNFVIIDNKSYLLDFIITPTFRPGQARPYWKTFHKRENWNTDCPVSDKLLTINLGNHGKFVFSPCPPFHLDKDECGDWLQWETLSPAKYGGKGDDFKALCTITEQLIPVADRKKGIGAHIDFPTWTNQLAVTTPPVDVISNELEKQFTTLTKAVERQIRQEIGKAIIPNREERDNHRPHRQQSNQRDRSRSPVHREMPPLTHGSGFQYPNYIYPGQGTSAMGYPAAPVMQQHYPHFSNVPMLQNHVVPALRPNPGNM